MSAFHYKAQKTLEDETTVTYGLNTDFILHPSEYIEVVIRKEDLKVLNYDLIKDLPDFKVSEKPLNWLKAKCTNNRVDFKEVFKHLA